MIRLFLIDSAVFQQLAITLVHFLWEGTVIAILGAVLAMVLRRQSSQSRYCVYLAAMSLMAACLPVTLAVVMTTSPTAGASVAVNELQVPPAGGAVPRVTPEVISLTTENAAAPLSEARAAATTLVAEHEQSVPADGMERARAAWHMAAPYVVATYLLGLAIMLLRVTASLYGGHRLRRDSIAVDEDALLTSIRRVATRIGLRRVPSVAFCRRVSGPVVIGILRPLVLLPVTLTTGLTAQQLEAILTHELSHLRRYDHLVLMLQRLVEAVLFFHPAVWYVSRYLSVERENCCDDAVIASGTPRVAYAELLLQLAELQIWRQSAPLGLAAAGEKPSRLRRRVSRLFSPPPEPLIRLSRLGIILLLCLLAAPIVAPALSHVFADPAALGPAETERADAQQSNGQEPGQPKWGEPLLGLRMRLSAPRGSEYRRGVPLPLLIEMQNVTDAPIRYADLHRNCDFKVFDEKNQWLGIAQTDIAVSLWEKAKGSLDPQQTIQWHVPFDRFWLNKPAAAGSTVQVLVSVPRQIEEPGKLPRTSYSAPITLKLIDAPPSVLDGAGSLPQLTAKDVSDRWAEDMDVVYREVGGLFLPSRAIHIDGQGNVTMIDCGAPGRTTTKLDRDRLHTLAARLKQMKIWDLSKVAWYKLPPTPDVGEARIALAYGGHSIGGIYSNQLIESNETLKALRSEMVAVIDEAMKTAAIGKEFERDEPKQPASGGKSKKSTVVPKNSPSHLAKIKRLDQQAPGNIIWGKPRHGLAVGIGEIRTSVESPRRPIIHAYLENRGKAPIGGVMQTRARFVVELDKQFYVEADFGGPIGDMPAGKRFGPIVLVTDHFNKTPRLEPESVVDQTTPGPDLTAGNHALRLHYKLEGANGVNQLIASDSIKFSVSLEPYPVDTAVAKIIGELQHADRDVRRNAALAAGKLRLAGSRDALVGVLMDKDKTIRRYAAESLGAIGDDAATKPLRELLADQEMEVRLAAAESLVKLGVPLEPSWVEPIIKSKHRVFQNAIWLVRRHGGKQAAPTLVRCLDFDDPSVNSYYNYTLVWQIHGCGGPNLKYMHDFDAKGTPEQIESNRRVLSTLKTWLDNQARGMELNDTRDAANRDDTSR